MTRTWREYAVASMLLGAGWLGCGTEGGKVRTVAIADECFGLADQRLCSGGVALECVEGAARSREDCAARSLQCADGLGCRVCAPYETSCAGATRMRCNRDGTAVEPQEECAAGLSCSRLGCVDLCKSAESDRSYLGCEYFPVFTANGPLDAQFVPAVSIGNGNLVPAHVVISRGDSLIEVDVPPRSSRTVELAYDPVLKSGAHSSLVRQGAYRLLASVPVTVHQFNPLYFTLPHDCADERDARAKDGVCHSFTNDASLLLPTSALRPDETRGTTVTYLVASRATMLVEGGVQPHASPGSLTVVAMGESPVQLSVRSSAYTLASFDGSADAIEALAPGGTLVRTLAPGDVLQLLTAAPTLCPGARKTIGRATFCDAGSDYDLTGTVIEADGPLQVIGGHDCANVPFDRVACDHLEESLPPLRSWGDSAVVTHPRVPDGSGSLIRVISGGDDNQITFDPALHDPRLLARGEYVELTVDEPVHVRGSKPIMVAQYLVGQGEIGNVGGDPSLSISTSVDQYRRYYNFSSPATYTFNYVDVVAKAGDVVRLDGVIVKGFMPVGQSGFSTATVQLMRPGAHELTSERSAGVGLVLYGIASFTSYMLPGGLDLKPIAEQGF